MCWPQANASRALELAGIADRFDVAVTGSQAEQLIARALNGLDLRPDQAVVVGVEPSDLEAARAVGAALAIGVARGTCTPEQLRRAGADAVSRTFRSCWTRPEQRRSRTRRLPRTRGAQPARSTRWSARGVGVRIILFGGCPLRHGPGCFGVLER
ncbi:MAG: HAD family hydrolase [Solirubrobacteraceae bacterium]